MAKTDKITVAEISDLVNDFVAKSKAKGNSTFYVKTQESHLRAFVKFLEGR